MNKLTKGYYHCIECGALFEAPLMDNIADQRCALCGNPPTGKVLGENKTEKNAIAQDFRKEPSRKNTTVSKGELNPQKTPKARVANQESQEVYDAAVAMMDAQKESRTGRVKRTKRKLGKGKKMGIVIGVWVLLMILTVVVMRNNEDDSTRERSSVRTALEKNQQLERERKLQEKFLNNALPKCLETMSRFLNADEPAAKAQYVYRGVEMVGKMEKYYRESLGIDSGKTKFNIVNAEMLHGFDHDVIGAICSNEKKERWEVVFIKENGEWKIDWPFLVRYDTRSWALFPTGKEGDEGDFRLYLRVRGADEELDKKEINVVLYKPNRDYKDDFKVAPTSSISLPIASPIGQKISALYKNENLFLSDERKDAHGFPIGLSDPARYHRVQVRLRLHKVGRTGQKAQFEIIKWIAHDWYGIKSTLKNTQVETK